MRSRTWTFTGWALAVSIVLGVLLLGLIFHLDSRAGENRTRLARARQDLDLLTKLRTRYRELEVRIAAMPVDTGKADSQTWQGFLSQKAQDADLPAPTIRPELTQRGALKENAFTVTIDAGSAGRLSRRNFVRFLDLVERQRPGFKSKTIVLTFSKNAPEDLQRASATFSHFER